MKLTGKVHEIGETQQVTDTFKKRDLIVEYAENPSYPEFIKFEAMQDKTSLIDTLNVGDQVEVDFNFRGKPWTDKTGKTSYFNSLGIWKLNVISSASKASEVVTDSKPGDDDDLPF